MIEIDGKTVKALARGDESAYAAVVDALYRPVRRFAVRLCGNEATADDITQETFLAVWRGVAAFKGKSRFTSWVFGIAYRQHLLIRNKKEVATVFLDIDRDGSVEYRSPEVSPESRMVMTVLERLPDLYWEVVFLVHIQGLTYKEASEALDIPVGTVKSRMNAAFNMLREQLSESEELCHVMR